MLLFESKVHKDITDYRSLQQGVPHLWNFHFQENVNFQFLFWIIHNWFAQMVEKKAIYFHGNFLANPVIFSDPLPTTAHCVNPNWHEGWYFYLLVIFGSDFFWLIYQNLPNFLKVKIDINWVIWQPAQLIESFKSCPQVVLKMSIFLSFKFHAN